MTAAEIKLVEWNKGDTFRVSDPMHTHAGKVGTLEFTMGGAAWLQMGVDTIQVRLDQLELVATAREVA